MRCHMRCCCIYVHMGVCNLCYAFCNSPRPQCSVLKLSFSKAEIRSFLKANGRLSATWKKSIFDLLLVYRVASHSSICKTIIMKSTKVQTCGGILRKYWNI